MTLLKDIFGDKIPEVLDETKISDEKRVKGKIIKLNKDTGKGGWGFITSKDIPFTRIFFHWTSLKQDTKKFMDLKEKMEVIFTPIEVPGQGMRAIKIEVLQ